MTFVVPVALAAILAGVGICCLSHVIAGSSNRLADVSYRRTVFAAVAASLALALPGWMIARGAARAWGFANDALRGGGATAGGVIPWWQMTARSSAVAYAATALLIGSLGAAALRWEERRLVSRFDAAGYNFLDEIGRSRLQLLRDRAAAAEAATGEADRSTSQPR